MRVPTHGSRRQPRNGSHNHQPVDRPAQVDHRVDAVARLKLAFFADPPRSGGRYDRMRLGRGLNVRLHSRLQHFGVGVDDFASRRVRIE